MLIQFNFKNYKSFRGQASLDMSATSIKEHPYNLIVNSKGEEYLKVAAIYGANASGKTSLIDAFDFMRTFVIESLSMSNKVGNIPVKPFMFDKSSKSDKSEFEVFFTFKEKEYQYGFTLDSKKVYEEWLYKRDFRGNSKYKTLFERSTNSIKCDNSFKEARIYTNGVDDTTLFVSLLAKVKIKEAKDVYEWFLNTQVLDYGNALIESFISRLLPVRELQDELYLNSFQKFLKAIDINIDGIRIEKAKNLNDEDGNEIYKVYSRHKMRDGIGTVEIPFSEESGGTQKMFCVYAFLMQCLENGATLFVDELDAKLHPLLLRYIIGMFNNPGINKKGAQLIYSTHDIYTLNRENFRRDQIWFTEKDTEGVSSLYSLAEYKLENDKKVRNDATYNKDYLAGRYGAVPLLREFDLWEDK